MTPRVDRHLDDRGPQQALLQLVAALQLLDDLVVAALRILDRLHGLVDARIKRLALRLDRRQSGAPEHLEHLAVDEFDSLSVLLRDSGIAVLERALEAIKRGQQRAHQVRRRVLLELFVLELGLLAQQPFVQIALLRDSLFVSRGQLLRVSGRPRFRGARRRSAWRLLRIVIPVFLFIHTRHSSINYRPARTRVAAWYSLRAGVAAHRAALQHLVVVILVEKEPAKPLGMRLVWLINGGSLPLFDQR